MGSFTPIGFPGKVFAWRDEAGYMGAFMAAGEALPQLRKGTRIGVEGQRMRVFDLFALQQALDDPAPKPSGRTSMPTDIQVVMELIKGVDRATATTIAALRR